MSNIDRLEEERKRAKVTLISTLPRPLGEEKPGMFPSFYKIPAALDKNSLGILHIGDAYYNELIPYGDSKAPPRRIDVSAERVAEGLIFDFISAVLGTNFEPDDNGVIRKPGLFWIGGVLYEKEIKKDFNHKIIEATRCTEAWFKSLVKIADDDWQKFRQHKMITEWQRTACKWLGINREWNFDAITASSTCPACMQVVSPMAIVCNHCKCILKPEEYKKLQFATA